MVETMTVQNLLYDRQTDTHTQYIYTTHMHVCTILLWVCHNCHRAEVMECLLRKANDLPTACRTIIRKERREQVM